MGQRGLTGEAKVIEFYDDEELYKELEQSHQNALQATDDVVNYAYGTGSKLTFPNEVQDLQNKLYARFSLKPRLTPYRPVSQARAGSILHLVKEQQFAIVVQQWEGYRIQVPVQAHTSVAMVMIEAVQDTGPVFLRRIYNGAKLGKIEDWHCYSDGKGHDRKDLIKYRPFLPDLSPDLDERLQHGAEMLKVVRGVVLLDKRTGDHFVAHGSWQPLKMDDLVNPGVNPPTGLIYPIMGSIHLQRIIFCDNEQTQLAGHHKYEVRIDGTGHDMEPLLHGTGLTRNI